MKLIGLDVGTRRIGVAIADSSIRIAVPHTTVTVNNGLEFTEIARIARANNTTWFVLGMPRSNNGNLTQQSSYVKKFAQSLASAVPGAKIKFQDESLTSVEAENRLKSRKRSYAKEEIDAEAASIFLQDFINNISVNSIENNDKALAMNSVRKTRNASTSTSVSKRAVKPASTEKKNNPSRLSSVTSSASVAPKAATRKRAARRASTQDGSTDGRSSKHLKKFVIIAGSIVAVLGIAVLVVINWYNSSLRPVYEGVECSTAQKDPRCDFIDFSVKNGDTVNRVGDNLEASGIIRNSFAFQFYMRSNNLDSQIKVGDYQFRRTMSVEEISKQLVAGAKNPNVFSFTILPGERIKSIKAKLIELGYDKVAIDSAFSKNYRGTDAKIDRLLASAPSSSQYGAEPLEGFLFGDTYEFYKTDSVEKIIITAMDAMWDVVEGNDLVKKYEQRGLTLYQGITLASIVQKEAKTLDQPTVAQVFFSRLSQNIVLGSDVTLQYALDLVDPERTTYGDNGAALELDNPYNTRKSQGLPPGPICNPGVSALLAVANPTDTSYMYFLTGDDGMMYYSDTESGHNSNISAHCQELCNVGL